MLDSLIAYRSLFALGSTASKGLLKGLFFFWWGWGGVCGAFFRKRGVATPCPEQPGWQRDVALLPGVTHRARAGFSWCLLPVEGWSHVLPPHGREVRRPALSQPSAFLGAFAVFHLGCNNLALLPGQASDLPPWPWRTSRCRHPFRGHAGSYMSTHLPCPLPSHAASLLPNQSLTLWRTFRLFSKKHYLFLLRLVQMPQATDALSEAALLVKFTSRLFHSFSSLSRSDNFSVCTSIASLPPPHLPCIFLPNSM